jgi:hypothetical protein
MKKAIFEYKGWNMDAKEDCVSDIPFSPYSIILTVIIDDNGNSFDSKCFENELYVWFLENVVIHDDSKRYKIKIQRKTGTIFDSSNFDDLEKVRVRIFYLKDDD